MSTVLPTPGPAEQADLAALDVGLEQVDDLDAGLEHVRTGLELVEGRGVAVDLPAVLDRADVVGVERLAEHVEDVAEGGVADGHGQAATQVAHRRAPVQAVGGLEADAADPALADLLGHLGGDGDLGALELEVHLDGHVDLGQRVRRELDVDDRPGDGDHPPLGAVPVVAGGGLGDSVVLSCAVLCFGYVGSWRRRPGAGPRRRPTISMISVVMASWRARFMSRVRVLTSSSAFSVAAAMARCRAVCSLAAASSRAPNSAPRRSGAPARPDRSGDSGSNSV